MRPERIPSLLLQPPKQRARAFADYWQPSPKKVVFLSPRFVLQLFRRILSRPVPVVSVETGFCRAVVVSGEEVRSGDRDLCVRTMETNGLSSGLPTGGHAFIPRAMMRPIPTASAPPSSTAFKSRFLPKHQKSTDLDRSSVSPDRSISAARPGNTYSLSKFQARFP